MRDFDEELPVPTAEQMEKARQVVRINEAFENGRKQGIEDVLDVLRELVLKKRK